MQDVRVAHKRENVKKFGISGKEERKELNWDVNDDMLIKKFQVNGSFFPLYEAIAQPVYVLQQ